MLHYKEGCAPYVHEELHRGWCQGILLLYVYLEATSLAQATAFDHHTIKAYFDILWTTNWKTRQRSKIYLQSGWNWMHNCPKSAKSCCSKGDEVSWSGDFSWTRWTCNRVWNCVSNRSCTASCFCLSTQELTRSPYARSTWRITWFAKWFWVMKAEIFVKVLEHFTGWSTERQIIVVMDNHDSHLALANIL